MRKDDVDSDLSILAFDFFYWFSRFEFALKENCYLKSHVPGEKAEPGWDEFTTKWREHYVASAEANALLAAPPQRQIVGANGCLDQTWNTVGLQDCKYDLEKIVRLVKTVRNNLFHGGKHGGESWDDPKRTRELLTIGHAILDQLAQLTSLEPDYKQKY